MALSQAKIDAYQQVDEAIDALVRSYEGTATQPGWMVNGWTLVVNEVRVPEADELDNDDDDLELQTLTEAFTRRGQNPLISLALAYEYIRHWHHINGGPQ